MLEQLRGGMGHHVGHGGHGGHGGRGGDDGGHMMMGAVSPLLGGDAGDVRYPYFLLNGRIADAPETFRAAPGTRLRLRLINAGSDTAFRVALGGHTLTALTPTGSRSSRWTPTRC